MRNISLYKSVVHPKSIEDNEIINSSNNMEYISYFYKIKIVNKGIIFICKENNKFCSNKIKIQQKELGKYKDCDDAFIKEIMKERIN